MGKAPFAKRRVIACYMKHQKERYDMKSILLALILLGVSQQCLSVLFPVLTNPRITRCIDFSAGGPWITCGGDVFYAADGTALVDIVPVDRPNRWNGTTLRAYTVHCNKGTTHPSDPRQPFTECNFRGTSILPCCQTVALCRYGSGTLHRTQPVVSLRLGVLTVGPAPAANVLSSSSQPPTLSQGRYTPSTVLSQLNRLLIVGACSVKTVAALSDL